MTEQAKPIRRRRRAARETIPDGEMRNVTFRVGSLAYNLLVKTANETGYSVSELGERLIEQHLGEKFHKDVKDRGYIAGLKPSDDADLSIPSARVLKTIHMVLAAYDKEGGWYDNLLRRIGARFAIKSILDHGMNYPPEVDHAIRHRGRTPEKIAADKGRDLGSIFWDPSEFLSKNNLGNDSLSQEETQKE